MKIKLLNLIGMIFVSNTLNSNPLKHVKNFKEQLQALYRLRKTPQFHSAVSHYKRNYYQNNQNQQNPNPFQLNKLLFNCLLLSVSALNAADQSTKYTKILYSDNERKESYGDNIRFKYMKWGKIEVNNSNESFTYKDAKVWTTNSKDWNWKETGTKHNPGIQIADIEEFINDVDIVILTNGVDGVLQVQQETIDYIIEKGKEYHVGLTPTMIKLYNELVAKGKNVGGLFHSTC